MNSEKTVRADFVRKLVVENGICPMCGNVLRQMQSHKNKDKIFVYCLDSGCPFSICVGSEGNLKSSNP